VPTSLGVELVVTFLETITVAPLTFLSTETETAPCPGSFLPAGGRASSWALSYSRSELSRSLLAVRKCASSLLRQTFSFGTRRFCACYHMHSFHSSLTARTSWIFFVLSCQSSSYLWTIISFFSSLLFYPRLQIGGAPFLPPCDCLRMPKAVIR